MVVLDARSRRHLCDRAPRTPRNVQVAPPPGGRRSRRGAFPSPSPDASRGGIARVDDARARLSRGLLRSRKDHVADCPVPFRRDPIQTAPRFEVSPPPKILLLPPRNGGRGRRDAGNTRVRKRFRAPSEKGRRAPPNESPFASRNTRSAVSRGVTSADHAFPRKRIATPAMVATPSGRTASSTLYFG